MFSLGGGLKQIWEGISGILHCFIDFYRKTIKVGGGTDMGDWRNHWQGASWIESEDGVSSRLSLLWGQ